MVERLDNANLIAIGFCAVPHFTIGNNVVYQLGRGRALIGSCIGQGNEALWLSHKDKMSGTISDLVCVHNSDYDGALTLKKGQRLDRTD